ncbi:MAG: L-aspartate oxidase [Steroidobacteraceae bacterium]|nr:L-aspartate oxidase [Steroidobacteraceae bacterium]
MRTRDTDVAIIGAGAAGLTTALNARGRRVLVIAPGTSSGASSDLAQGGIAAAVDPGDSVEQHFEDTIAAGQPLVAPAAARYLCNEGPNAIQWLATLGVAFARDGHHWSLHREAAHSCARVLHVGGAATGAAITATLRGASAASTHIETEIGLRAVQLLLDGNGVCGVLACDATGRAIAIRARAVVIATGGIGGLYARTTNPLGACGDGLAIALAAGARARALEFVQFHPTALDVESQPLPLITEALRGAGARLVDLSGAPVTARIPGGDLAPRDVVARAVFAVQQQGGRVRLDARRLRGGSVSAQFPQIVRVCRSFGIDPEREPIPVTPAAHYHMGGIAVDLDGHTSLRGLWAVGEAACNGVHGANRLASNSLLEAIVFGRRVGALLARAPLRALPGAGDLQVAPHAPPETTAPQELRALMWRAAGVARDGATLSRGLTTLAGLERRAATDDCLGRARLLLARRILEAALARTRNCGAHWRGDARPEALAASA